MTGSSAVGVNDNLASGEPCVSLGPADDEAARGVDEEFGVFIYQFPGQDGVEDIFFDIPMDLLLGHILVMLGGEHHGL